MVVVTVEQGKLRGGDAVTASGYKYYEFLTVPYAKPPIGDLRFKVKVLEIIKCTYLGALETWCAYQFIRLPIISIGRRTRNFMLEN